MSGICTTTKAVEYHAFISVNLFYFCYSHTYFFYSNEMNRKRDRGVEGRERGRGNRGRRQGREVDEERYRGGGRGSGRGDKLGKRRLREGERLG